MSTTNIRGYSKSMAVANHAISVGQVLAVPFQLFGPMSDQLVFGVFRAQASMVLTGFRADFETPSGDASTQCSVALYTGSGQIVAGAAVYLNGVILGNDAVFTPPIQMPPESIWKLVVSFSVPDDAPSADYPQNLTVQYLLRYASGPVNTNLFSMNLTQAGVGFDQIGNTPILT